MDTITSATAVAPSNLPYRSTFVEHIELTNPNNLSKASQCDICLEPINDLHRPVVLHDNHVFGKSCILEWLAEKGTCPLCRKAICRDDPMWVDYDGVEVCVNYDEENLELLRHMQQMSLTGSDHLRMDLANLCFRYMHSRAMLYFLGELKVDATQYRDYPRDPFQDLGDPDIYDRVLTVHANDLTMRLHGIFTSLFIDDNNAGSPSIVSHPWSVRLLVLMLDTIYDLDGMEMSGNDLYHEFRAVYETEMADHTTGEPVQLRNVPSGWNNFADHMWQMVACGFAVRWFSEV